MLKDNDLRWGRCLLAILSTVVLSAAAAVALPDNPYQRWQLIENTLYANATWSYERINFDSRPINVAIIGPSRTQLGLSAPRIEARIAALGYPLTVANLAVVEGGRNLEWAIADELFRNKRPQVVVVSITETVHPWGHPGFKFVSPVAAIVAPRALLLHNAKDDVPYLPYRQLFLFGASFAPNWFGLRDRFDAARFAAKPDDYTVTRVLADGKRIDMDRDIPAADLRAERAALAASHKDSLVPAVIRRVTDADDHVYVEAITRLAAAHGTRVIFLFIPEFEGATTIADRAFYAARGSIADTSALANDPHLFQSFAHLNHRGAMIASEQVAAAIVAELARQAVPVQRTAASPAAKPVTPVTN